MTTLEFEVIGHPRPGGSKRAIPIRKGGRLTGRVAVVDSNVRVRDWRALVTSAAVDAIDRHAGEFPLTTPLELRVEVVLARPAGHYGQGRNRRKLRDAAPAWPAVRPDLTKFLRPIEDCLNGLVWIDDALIVRQVALKTYGGPEGARIRIRELDEFEHWSRAE